MDAQREDNQPNCSSRNQSSENLHLAISKEVLSLGGPNNGPAGMIEYFKLLRLLVLRASTNYTYCQQSAMHAERIMESYPCVFGIVVLLV